MRSTELLVSGGLHLKYRERFLEGVDALAAAQRRNLLVKMELPLVGDSKRREVQVQRLLAGRRPWTRRLDCRSTGSCARVDRDAVVRPTGLCVVPDERGSVELALPIQNVVDEFILHGLLCQDIRIILLAELAAALGEDGLDS